MYAYNYLGVSEYKVVSDKVLPEGKVTIRYDFKYDGGGIGKGGTVTTFVNGEKVAEGRFKRTQGLIFSTDEGADVSQDDGTNITSDYNERENKFTGKITRVTISVKDPEVSSPKIQSDQ